MKDAFYDEYGPREDPTNKSIAIVPIEVKFYLGRLADLTDLKQNIDRGLYPLNNYEGVPMMEEGEVRGLRWGIIRGIWGTRQILSKMGYEKEVDTYLKFAKKSQAESQQEGRQ